MKGKINIMKKQMYFMSFLCIFVLGLFWGCQSNSKVEGNDANAQGTDTLNNNIPDPGGSSEPIKIEHDKVVRDPATNIEIVKRKSKSPFSGLGCCKDQIQPCCCDTVWKFYETLLKKNYIKERTDIITNDPYFYVCDSSFESFRRQIHMLDSLKFGQ